MLTLLAGMFPPFSASLLFLSLTHFPNKNKGMGLVAAQFVVGGYDKATDGTWVANLDHWKQLRSCIQHGNLQSCEESFREWWSTMEFILRFCAINNTNDNLLWAALSNRDTPPPIIELVLRLYPDTLHDRIAFARTLPLHLTASVQSYVPRIYERPQLKKSTSTNLLGLFQQTTKYNPIKCREIDTGRSALHLALAQRKTWSDIRPLVSGPNRKSTRARDPVTGLYPFQLAALPRISHEPTYETLLLRTRNRYDNDKWASMSTRRRDRAVARVVKEDDLEALRTIYELLRRYPSGVRTALREVKAVKQKRDGTGMGMVGAHFVVWCFEEPTTGPAETEMSGNGSTVGMLPRKKNISELKRAIHESSLSGELGVVSSEFAEWWNKMKFWIWYCFTGETGTTPKEGKLVMPQEDRYLLHAALASSDTPPQVVELLLGLYPSSTSLNLPQTSMLPLHIAATTLEYTKRLYEETPRRNTVTMVAEANSRAIHGTVQGQLPLHLAIVAGKTWDEIEPLSHGTLKSIDPKTGLFPFQLAAMQRSTKPEQQRQLSAKARNTQTEEGWKNTSTRDKNRMLRTVQSEHRLAQFSTLFEMIRKEPSTIELAIRHAVTEASRVAQTKLGAKEGHNDERSERLSTLGLPGITEGDEDEDDEDDENETSGGAGNKTGKDGDGAGDGTALTITDFIAQLDNIKDREKRFESDTQAFAQMDVMSVISASSDVSETRSFRSLPADGKKRRRSKRDRSKRSKKDKTKDRSKDRDKSRDRSVDAAEAEPELDEKTESTISETGGEDTSSKDTKKSKKKKSKKDKKDRKSKSSRSDSKPATTDELGVPQSNPSVIVDEEPPALTISKAPSSDEPWDVAKGETTVTHAAAVAATVGIPKDNDSTVDPTTKPFDEHTTKEGPDEMNSKDQPEQQENDPLVATEQPAIDASHDNSNDNEEEEQRGRVLFPSTPDTSGEYSPDPLLPQVSDIVLEQQDSLVMPYKEEGEDDDDDEDDTDEDEDNYDDYDDGDDAREAEEYMSSMLEVVWGLTGTKVTAEGEPSTGTPASDDVWTFIGRMGKEPDTENKDTIPEGDESFDNDVVESPDTKIGVVSPGQHVLTPIKRSKQDNEDHDVEGKPPQPKTELDTALERRQRAVRQSLDGHDNNGADKSRLVSEQDGPTLKSTAELLRVGATPGALATYNNVEQEVREELDALMQENTGFYGPVTPQYVPTDRDRRPLPSLEQAKSNLKRQQPGSRRRLSKTKRLDEDASFLEKRQLFGNANVSNLQKDIEARNAALAYRARVAGEDANAVYRSRWAGGKGRRGLSNMVHYTNRMEEKFLPCLQCGEGKRETMVLPCNHLCICSRCSVRTKLNKCPICDKAVKDYRVVYL